MTRTRDGANDAALVVTLTASIVAVTDEEPRVLTVALDRAAGEASDAALPTGPLDPAGDRTLDLALRRWVRAQTGIELGYVEQLYTFGDRFRDPREQQGGPRMVSVAYLALVREGRLPARSHGRWRGGYDFLPWEDWRGGRPEVIDRHVAPALRAWIDDAADASARRIRRERAGIAFGLDGAPWDGERVLERYELLYELGLVPESARDAAAPAAGPAAAVPGDAMAFDHRRILATAVARMRGKLRYRPVIFELVPATFTLLQLQRAVEALAGVRLHKQNFRRLLEHGGLVERTGRIETRTGGRPAELFRFRREVLRERPAPGVGLPATGRRAPAPDAAGDG